MLEAGRNLRKRPAEHTCKSAVKRGMAQQAVHVKKYQYTVNWEEAEIHVLHQEPRSGREEFWKPLRSGDVNTTNLDCGPVHVLDPIRKQSYFSAILTNMLVHVHAAISQFLIIM